MENIIKKYGNKVAEIYASSIDRIVNRMLDKQGLDRLDFRESGFDIEIVHNDGGALIRLKQGEEVIDEATVTLGVRTTE